MKNNIQKYQWGKVLKWLGTSLDDGVRFVRKPLVTRQYAKMGVDVTAPQNQRIIASLSGLDFGNNLQMDIPTWTLRRSLIDQGVDPRLLSELNLYKLVNKRINALDLGLNFPSKYAIRYDVGWTFPHHEYHLFRGTPLGGNRVGTLSTVTRINGDHTINMISNITSGKNRVSGISEQGYNAAIQDLGSLISGEVLMAPHITTRVWNKFPTKTLLGNHGRHHYPNADVDFEFGPIWRLEAPTYQQPIKFGNNFDVMSITPNGRFTVDFNKGPMFKHGGKIEKFWPGGILGKGTRWLSGIKASRIMNRISPRLPYNKSIFDNWHPIGKYNELVRGSSGLGLIHHKPGYQLIDVPGWTVKPATAIELDHPGITFSTGGHALVGENATMMLSSRDGRILFPNFKTKVMYDFGPGNYKSNQLATQRTKGSAVLPIENGIMYPAEKTGSIWWEQNGLFYPDDISPTFVIDNVIPTESSIKKYGWGSNWSRVSGPVDLTDPKLNFRFITKDPITGFPVESPFILPKESDFWKIFYNK